MKIVILILIALICVLIGYIVSKKYRVRANFFQALLYLCQKFDIEINYSRERVKNIFLNLDDKYKKDLKGIDINYISFLDKQVPLDKDNLFKNITFLKENEKEMIFSFFKTLGRSDVDSQSKEIKNFQTRFDELAKDVNSDYKKYGSLSIKLGIITGLLIIVIFI